MQFWTLRILGRPKSSPAAEEYPKGKQCFFNRLENIELIWDCTSAKLNLKNGRGTETECINDLTILIYIWLLSKYMSSNTQMLSLCRLTKLTCYMKRNEQPICFRSQGTWTLLFCTYCIRKTANGSWVLNQWKRTITYSMPRMWILQFISTIQFVLFYVRSVIRQLTGVWFLNLNSYTYTLHKAEELQKSSSLGYSAEINFWSRNKIQNITIRKLSSHRAAP